MVSHGGLAGTLAGWARLISQARISSICKHIENITRTNSDDNKDALTTFAPDYSPASHAMQTSQREKRVRDGGGEGKKLASSLQQMTTLPTC